MTTRSDIYQQPEELPRSPLFRAFLDEQEVPVLHSAEAAIVCFGLNGPANLRVEVLWDLPHHAIYRPLSRGRRIELDGQSVNLELPGPERCVIQVDRGHSLFVFADPIEANRPPENTANWRIFEPGKIHDLEHLELEPNQSCWIPGGAAVRGSVLARGSENFEIRGPGILLGDFQNALGPFTGIAEGKSRSTLQLAECRNVTLKDLLILDSRAWTTVLCACDGVELSNHKVVTWSICDDGIDVVGSRDVHIHDSFVCSRDDNISVKASNYSPFLAVDGARDIAGLRVERSLFLNADCGNALEVGMELKADSVRDLIFRDNDILRVEVETNLSGAALSVHCGNWAKVENVLFEDIRIEQAVDKLIDVGIFHSPYEAQTNPGQIERLRFKDIQLLGGLLPRSFIEGLDADHKIREIDFDGFRMVGPASRGVLNKVFGLDSALPKWPELPLDRALEETMSISNAEDIRVNGRTLPSSNP